MLKCSDPFTSKSATYMLAPFQYYKTFQAWTFIYGMIIIYMTGFYALGQTFQKSHLSTIILSLNLIGFITSYCCCRKTLQKRVQERFLEKNGHIQYDAVCKEFSSFYKNTIPINESDDFNENL